MAPRALIIAIEDYGGQLSALPGNVKAGSEFRQWLIEDKGVLAGDILFCASHDVPGRTAGTTRMELVAAIQQLYRSGVESTEELYVYFSGHGFSYQSSPWAEPVPVLVASNFHSWQQLDFAFLSLSELHFQLRRAMGPGNHYYFFDACRTLVNPSLVQVPPLGLLLPQSQIGTAHTFILYAVTDGMPAPADAHFGTILLEGLRGRGRAKVWNEGKLQVTFERLMSYVSKRLRQREIDGDIKSNRPGILYEFPTVPLTTCTVQVEGAGEGDRFELVTMDVRQLGSRQHSFTGPRHELQVQPDDYRFELKSGEQWLSRVAPVPAEQPVDLYEAQVVTFQRPSALESFSLEEDAGLAPWSHHPMLNVLGAPEAKVLLHRLGSGERLEALGSFVGQVEPGRYEVTLEERGVVVARQRMVVEGDEPKTVTLLKPPVLGPARESIRGVLGSTGTSALVDFSEQLGPMANQDLSLWLTLMGAAHIVRPPDAFSKLSRFPLERFEDFTPDSSGVYVLAGFDEEREGGTLCVEGAMRPLSRVGRLQRVWHGLLKVPQGSHLLSLQVPGWLRMDLATHALPNHITLVVLSEAPRARSERARGRERTGRPQVRQLLLPLHSLRQHLNPEVDRRLQQAPDLQAIRFAALAQERFARLAPMEEVDPRFWRSLREGEWLDPVMLVLTAYERVRRGEARSADLRTVVAHLRTYFPGMPDTEALARLIGEAPQAVQGLPLFLEGLSPLEMEARAHQEAGSGMRLDFEGPWTAWLGAAP